MRTAIWLLMACLCLGGEVLAQDVRAAGAADSTRIRETIFRRLFDGMPLSEAQARQARMAIAGTHAAQAKLIGRMNAVRWKEYVALQERRDSALVRLLQGEAQRAAFRERAASMRPRSSRWGGSVESR